MIHSLAIPFLLLQATPADAPTPILPPKTGAVASIPSTTAPLPPIPVLKNAKKLGLTEDQIKKLTAIQAKYAIELAAKRQALVDSSMAFQKETRAVLTAEQSAKAKKLRIPN